jgi:hypothetical protein
MSDKREGDKDMKGAKKINEERGSGITNVGQMKGICKKGAKQVVEKLRNEVNQSPLNLYGVLH